MENLTALTDKELKSVEYDILCQLDRICTELGLRYSLCGGSLLGAVRHKGFIPWDDDIDLFMPRPDFDRLTEYCLSKPTPFRFICHSSDESYGYLFAKASDKSTVIKDENCSDNDGIGVYVDIFPIEGLGKTEAQAKKLFSSTRFLRELLVARSWKRYFLSKTHPLYLEPVRLCFFIMSRFFSKKQLIARIEKHYSLSFEESDWAGCICGSYRQKEILPKKVYDQFIRLPFEQGEFMAIKDYHTWLTAVYGDYMTPPEEQSRVSHHSFTAYRK